ncbi:MAG TPA: 50S ribosomal protein L10 [Desulfosalsimonadaceae bacterium]|nr:50S ribosomal protein L10 [Desulfosalsimonadaceae bacterium]
MRFEQKKELVGELAEKFSRSTIVIATDFKGLNVVKLNELRRKLGEADIEYQVVKNRLLIRAAEGSDVARLKDRFQGPTGIAMGYGDPVQPAKVLMNFAKDNEKLEIKGGVMNGKALDFEAVKSLSELPSREILLGQLLSVMNNVPTGFVRALNNVPERLVYALQAIKDQKEAA